jgi:hypothetical protein
MILAAFMVGLGTIMAQMADKMTPAPARANSTSLKVAAVETSAQTVGPQRQHCARCPRPFPDRGPDRWSAHRLHDRYRRIGGRIERKLVPNTYAYESEPMVKPTGFREYDARWLFGKEINLMGIQALGMGLGTLIARARREAGDRHRPRFPRLFGLDQDTR